MDLNKVFEAFVTPQTVVVCLAVYLLTFVIRKIAEGVWKGAKESRLWREVWLPIGPIANGAFVGAVAKTFVWPSIVGTSLSGRIMYGAICGVFSGFLYNRIRAWLQSAPAKVAVPVKGATPAPVETGLPPAASDPPPADAPADPPADDKTPPTGRS